MNIIDPYVKVSLMQNGRRIRRDFNLSKSNLKTWCTVYFNLLMVNSYPFSLLAFEVSLQEKENFNKKVHPKSLLQRISHVWSSPGMDSGLTPSFFPSTIWSVRVSVSSSLSLTTISSEEMSLSVGKRPGQKCTVVAKDWGLNWLYKKLLPFNLL